MPSNKELGFRERGKGKFKADRSTTDYYKFYIDNINKKELPLGGNYKQSKYYVKNTIYKNVLMSIFRKARVKMVVTNNEYPLPCRMGRISLEKIKKQIKIDENGRLINKPPVDYKATRELWNSDSEAKEKRLKVYRKNEHTDGYRLYITWNKSTTQLYKRAHYRFEAVREFKREIPKILKEHNNIDFYISRYSD